MKTFVSIGVLLVPAVAFAANEVDSLRRLVNTHCVSCHGPVEPKSDLRLDDLSKLDDAAFALIHRRIAAGEMPPAEAKTQPTAAERREIVTAALARAKNAPAEPTTGFRRLNKREYGNTVRDLLGLGRGIIDPAEYVFNDEIDDGFDTRAEALVVSNELLLEYMSAAQKSLRHALFTWDAVRPKSKVIAVPLNATVGTDKRYINHRGDHVILRAGGPHKLYDGTNARPMTFPGRYAITITVSVVDRDTYPVKFQPIEGPLVMGIGMSQEVAESVSSDGLLLKTFELEDDVERTIRFETWIDQGHYPYLSFVNGAPKPITRIRGAIRRGQIDPAAEFETFVGPGLKISRFEIEGPIYERWPPESLRVTCDADHLPDLESAAERSELVARFARRAFRGDVSDEELAPYRAYLESRREVHQDWREAIIDTFSAMMASLDFLYLREQEGELDSFAVANRLSYFLWSTMPDAELLELARGGAIKNPAVLRAQVERLLNDERSSRFCESFAEQWLSLDLLGTMPPDGRGGYRVYHDEQLEPAMLEETHRFFKHVFQQNLGVREFLDANYSFLNQRLAKHYGVPFEGGGGYRLPFEGGDEEFVRVEFPAGAPRGGLLGHASILTLTANGVDTSPIDRGVWVLANLMGTPPPPPPKEVPALTPDLNGAATIRDLLEKHRADASCMECHRRIDPLGFALEAFDPIGRFRKNYSREQRVSTEGNYLGRDFADVTGLKRILTADIRPFARSLVVRVAEYAKGRELNPADQSTVEAILDDHEAGDFKLRDLITAIATSDLLTRK